MELRAWAISQKREVMTLCFALRDSRTPWYAKALGFGLVAYALSPIDLIPDFIPVLGLLDDLIIVPLGIALVLPMIPPHVLADCRLKAAEEVDKPRSRAGAVLVIVTWLFTALLIYLTLRKGVPRRT